MVSVRVALLLMVVSLSGCLGFGSDDPSAVSDGPEKVVAPPCAADDLECICGDDRICKEERLPTDEDGDGLFWLDEQKHGSDPLNNDTDGDGMSDGDEVAAGRSPIVPWFPNDGASEMLDILVESIGGHKVPATVYRPLVANATQQVPILLHSHGFTGSRMAGADSAKAYVEAGFGVVSFDQRGHGDATDTSVVNFMQPDIEVMDAIALIDEIASWDWVLMENETTRDPVLGGIGYSYAGAFQMLTSVFDDRMDAMVPEMTWNNITTALAPNGVIKSGWVDLFYAAGNTISPITFSDDFHAGFAWATAANELPAGQVPGVVPDLVSLFNRASLDTYPDKPGIPTRLIHSPIDTLFPLNQAVWNYNQLRSNGAPVQLYTYLGGHTLHSDSLYGESPIGYGAGLQGAPGGWPCGGREELGIEWHAKYLLQNDVDVGPNVCISLENGEAIVGSTFPLPWTSFEDIDVGGPYPVVQGASAGAAIPLYLHQQEFQTTVAGIPRLAGTITAPGPDTILYFSFYKADDSGLMEHIVDDQVRPLRIKGPNTDPVAFDIELGGIATKLDPNEAMVLMVTSVEAMYFGNSQRLPSGVVLDDLVLTMPMVYAPKYL